MVDTVVTETTTNATETQSGNASAETAPQVEDGKADKTTETTIEYKDFKLPEGMESSPESLAAFKTLAGEYKLTQEQAQKLVDMQAGLMSKYTKATEDRWAEVNKEWKAAAQSDKEFGGKDFAANLGIAKKALEKYGSPALKDAIELTGMGNHPEFIRLLFKIGQTLKEDKVMDCGQESGNKADLAKRLFPTMN